jgi:exocyst complex component 2
MHQTLLQYVTPQTAELVKELYTAISDSYDRRPTGSGNPQQDLQAQLEGVKKTLSESRKATQINFVCFKKDRTRSVGERDRDRSQTPSASSASGRRDREGDASGSQRRRP